jgi:putative nucleotidyltransferase with HDIG domain
MAHGQTGKEAFEQMIREAIRQFPSMPSLCRDVMEQIRNPNADYAVLAERLRLDPGVTMNVLKVANSSFFAGSRRVDSLLQAFVRLGSRRLFQIMLTQNVAGRMAVRLTGYELEPHALLRHSLFTALAAETLTKKLKLGFGETMFTCGLLHDMGKLVMDEYAQALHPILRKHLENEAEPFDAIEHELFGITHAEAGALLMREWRFPEDLTAIVQTHHRPDRSDSHGTAARIVRLADRLADARGCGDGMDRARYDTADAPDDNFGLATDELADLTDQMVEKLDELESVLTAAAS